MPHANKMLYPKSCAIIITSVQNVRWGEGRRVSKTDARFFQNFKMTMLFQQNHHCVGGGRGFAKSVRFVRS